MTGFHNFEPAFGGKWLEVLKEVAPGVRRVAVLHVPEISANLALLRSIETASKALGITVIPAAARNAGDVERVLTAFAREPDGGLIVTPSPLTGTRRDVIIGVARQAGAAGRLFVRILLRERRLGVLWNRSTGAGARRGVLRGSHSTRSKRGRASGATADQIPLGSQSEDR